MRVETLGRLIDIKRDELHQLRLDVQLLEQLVESSRIEHERAVSHCEQWMESMRAMEGERNILSATGMKEARDFLAHLYRQSQQAEHNLAEVTKQRDSAQKTLNQMFVEKKTYELIDERYRSAIRKEQLRRQQTSADDEELIRIGRIKHAHAQY